MKEIELVNGSVICVDEAEHVHSIAWTKRFHDKIIK